MHLINAHNFPATEELDHFLRTEQLPRRSVVHAEVGTDASYKVASILKHYGIPFVWVVHPVLKPHLVNSIEHGDAFYSVPKGVLEWIFTPVELVRYLVKERHEVPAGAVILLDNPGSVGKTLTTVQALIRNYTIVELETR